MKRIGILTSGGDSPGMNAAVRSVARTAITMGHEVYGIYYGFKGLLEEEIVKFDRFSVSEKMNLGGTFIRSARFPEFKEVSVREEAIKVLEKYGIEYLVVIGGDGSFMGARKLTEMGIKCIGLPGTIDNDLNYTDYTIGFDTAVNTVVESIDKLRDTSGSHQRCSIVEVMGRNCGDLAIHSALSTGAKSLITPETGFDKEALIKDLYEQNKIGIKYSIVVITENITDVAELAKEIEERTKIETRATILGYIQRGGSPTAFDRVLAMKLGKRAVELIDKGHGGRCVGVDGDEVVDYDIIEALEMPSKDRTNMINTFNLTK
ncbi:6-phosphofructokinase [Mycoplasmatota bacterium WC44]